MYEKDLALNDLKWLIYNKTKPNKNMELRNAKSNFLNYFDHVTYVPQSIKSQNIAKLLTHSNV